MFRYNKMLLTGVVALSLITLQSCSKTEGCTDPAALNFNANADEDCCCEYATTFDLDMHLHPYVGASGLTEGSIYNLFGVQTQLDLVQFYVSNIRLVDAAGNETAANTFLLVKPETEEYTVGAYPEGTYTSIRFDIGMDSVTNHGDPTQYPTGDPLGPQFPNMSWGWDMGYIFVRVDGIADQNLDGTPETFFEMHVGDEPLLRTVELDFPLTGEAGGSYTAHINVNWLDFFDGIDMTGDISTHTSDNMTLATALADNLQGMFSIEE